MNCTEDLRHLRSPAV